MTFRGSVRVAFVTLAAVARAVTYTVARCPDCDRKLMTIPGEVMVEVRKLRAAGRPTGMGRVLSCKRCAELCEVIERV